MKSFRSFFDISEEEAWLNAMAKQGLRLTRVGFGGHTFERAKPEDTTIRIDYRMFKSKDDYTDYIALFEDSGWQHIAGSKFSGIQYFKQIHAEHDDIFSDTASKAARYRRRSYGYLFMMLCFLIIMSPSITALLTNSIVTDYAQAGIDFSYFNPKTWYFTPGLWESSGIRFWFAFCFETPFALGRVFGWLLPLACAVMYLVCAAKLHLLYKQTAQQGR